jgi:uncharacterized membrane protein
MLSVIFKMIHVTGISIWIAGLVALPTLYLQRKGRAGNDLHRLHAFVRALYVRLLSPAAFVAIASGTALIFIEATFETWFSLKLLLVAGLIAVHIGSGLVILRLFEVNGHYHPSRAIISTALSLTLASGILFLVLGEPRIGSAFDTVFAPGALGEMLQPLVPF